MFAENPVLVKAYHVLDARISEKRKALEKERGRDVDSTHEGDTTHEYELASLVASLEKDKAYRTVLSDRHDVSPELLSEATNVFKNKVDQLTEQKQRIKAYLASGALQTAGLDDYALEQVENKLAQYTGLYKACIEQLDPETAHNAIQATKATIENLQSSISSITQRSTPLPEGDTTDETYLKRTEQQLAILYAQLELFTSAVPTPEKSPG